MRRDNFHIIKFCLVALCFKAAASASSIEAQIFKVSDIRGRIAQRPAAATYLDLVKTVFPDAKLYKTTVMFKGAPQRTEYGFEATRTVPLRNLFGRYQGTRFEGEMRIERLETTRARTPEGERLLLLMSVVPIQIIPTISPGGMTLQRTSLTRVADETRKIDDIDVLALFRLEPKPKLLDVVDARKDGQVYSVIYFSDLFPHLRVAARQDGFFIINELRLPKSNNYVYTLLTAEKDRLKMLSDFPLTLGDSEECQVKLHSSGSFLTGAGKKGGYRSINVESVFEYENFASDCKRLVGRSKTITRYDLLWDAERQKYDFSNRKVRHVNIPLKKGKLKK